MTALSDAPADAARGGGTRSSDTRGGAGRGSDFAVLCRQVREAQLLRRRYGSYALRISVTLGAFAAAWTGFVLLGNSWWQLAVAAVLGVLFTQVGFLGHDAGHRQIWHSKKANELLSVIAADLLIGLSFGWWVDKHNRHHAHPNEEGQDPDIGDGVLAFTNNQIARRHAGVGRFVARHQAWLFFPLLLLEGLNLHVASARFIKRGEGSRYQRGERVLFLIHLVAYFGGLALVLDPLHAIAFLAVHQSVFGFYMGCSFAPNHKGMPIIEDERDLDFLRRQVLTSRNVRGGWFTDLLLGGLNYQVEHHLFPSMPRASLRKAQVLVRDYCAAHRIPYAETSLLGSYVIVLRHLHALGAPLRTQRPLPS